MPPLPDIARVARDEHRMLPPSAVVLAMVSGGADSTAMLRLLAAGELGEIRLSVLHVDHALRPESADDAEWVSAACAELGVPCRIVRYDVAGYAEAEGLNLEDAGRRVRYRFAHEELDARCDEAGSDRGLGRIAVAHTLDDRVETFLMRVVTGAGAGGLTSLRAVRGRIVRPLAGATRADVVAYLERLGQSWREDATNADTARLRARIRHEVVPVLEAVNPNLHATLERTVRILAEEDDLLSGMAEAFARDFAQVGPDGALAFDRALMRTLSPPMARRTVRAAMGDAFPDAQRMEAAHTDAIVAGLADDGFARDIGFGLRAHTEYERLLVRPSDSEPARIAPTLLPVPGTADLGRAGSITAIEAPPAPIPAGPDVALLDADRLSGPLVVDSPRDGDRMRPLGMDGTKKVGDLMTDEKVPERLRPGTPVVRDAERVVWVAGVRPSEDTKVTAATRRAVMLRWERAPRVPGGVR